MHVQWNASLTQSYIGSARRSLDSLSPLHNSSLTLSLSQGLRKGMDRRHMGRALNGPCCYRQLLAVGNSTDNAASLGCQLQVLPTTSRYSYPPEGSPRVF